MKLAITTLLLLCVVLPRGSEAGPQTIAGNVHPARILGLKTSYADGEIVTFRVNSLSDVDRRFSCGVEFSASGGWREVVLSVFADDPQKSTRVELLPPRGSLSLDWNPWRGAPDAPFPSGEYRLRVDFYGKGGSQVVETVYSEPFKIVRARSSGK
jgi:hypothetical protein